MLVRSLSNHNHNDSNWFCEENNSSARTSRFLAHFGDVKQRNATIYGGREYTQRRIFLSLFEPG